MAEALDPALPRDIERLAQEVLSHACARNLGLVTAESCTGGMLAALLTDIPGKSHVFERGFVTYAEVAKREVLGVPAAIIRDHGAVSEACAVAMAKGALERSHADLAISVTGFTEDGPQGEPAGLVHIACAVRGGGVRSRCERFGRIGRAAVRLSTLRAALRLAQNELHGLSEAA